MKDALRKKEEKKSLNRDDRIALLYKALKKAAKQVSEKVIPPNALTECFKIAHSKRQNKDMSPTQRSIVNEGVLKPLMARLLVLVEKLHEALVFLTFSRPPGVFKLTMETFFLGDLGSLFGTDKEVELDD